MVSSRRLLVVLWLLLALLPLRGWAAAVMHLPAGDASAAASAMPCHGTAEHAGETLMAGAGDSTACTLCDLCHGVVAWAQPVQPAAVPLADTPPSGGSPSALQIVPTPLYRPPRG